MSWFILLLSLNLVDSATYTENTIGRYCNSTQVDIYLSLDGVSQDASLTTAEIEAKCATACQSSYAYAPRVTCTQNSDCPDAGSSCLNGFCSHLGGGFTIGTAESGCTDVDQCYCREKIWANCPSDDKESYGSSNTCFESYEYDQPTFDISVPTSFLEIDSGSQYVKLTSLSGTAVPSPYCIQTLPYKEACGTTGGLQSQADATCNAISSNSKCTGSGAGNTCEYINNMNAVIEVKRAMTMSGTQVTPFRMESSQTCQYDYVSMGSSNLDGHVTNCKQNADLSVTVGGDTCSAFCGTTAPPSISMNVGDTIIVRSDGSVTDAGFRICATGVPASGTLCSASTDPNDDPPDPVTGEFYCPDGDVSGFLATGCTCTPKQCITQSPMTEAWHKNCVEGDATGTAGNCKCDCFEDDWGGDYAKGGRCIGDVNECTNNPAQFPHRSTERCSPQATCSNINKYGYTCACAYGWETASASDFSSIDQTECLDGATIAAVQAIVPPAVERAYGTVASNAISLNFLGAGCNYYTDEVFPNNNRVLFNTGTFVAPLSDTFSYAVCKCEVCDQTYHLAKDPFTACSAYTPDEGHACKRKACVIADPVVDTWEIACANGAAAGVSDSCTCTCPVDSVSTGKFTWKGTLCETDVDECTETDSLYAQHNCDANAACANTDGGFTCTCNPGFTGDGVTCTANPCVLDDGVDPAEPWEIAGCQNGATAGGTTGACTCVCPKDGSDKFLWFGGTCGNDVDECTNTNPERAVDTCSTSGQCIDEDGGHDCTCDATATQGGDSAADIIYCDNGASATGTRDTGCACDCSTTGSLWSGTNCDVCSNTGAGCLVGGQAGVFTGQCRCICPLIQQQQTNALALVFIAYGPLCEFDVNECTNVPGSVGYDATIATNTCSDDATCTDLVGSAFPTVQGWSCTCNYGFEGDGETCTLKQCVQADPAVEDWEINCVNGNAVGSSGSCACDCPTGYDGLDTWEGPDCGTDVNECTNTNPLHSTNNCHSDATCTNNDGGFSCACNAGYDGDGVTCTPKTCVVSSGTDPHEIDCQNGASATGNTDSPCACVCPFNSDFLFQYHGTLCENDVDECTNDPVAFPDRAVHNCDANAACTNSPGGFSCACNPGFSGDGVTCTADACVLADPADDPWEIAGCQNGATAGGTTGACFCDCPEDINGLKTWFGGTCGNDVDECTNTNPQRAVHNCDANAACTNAPGSFICSCNPGYTGDGVTCNFAPCEIGDPNVQINYIDCVVGTATGVANSCGCLCPTDANGKFTAFGQTCQNDVDECTNQVATRAVHNCNANAACTDLPGSFSCACNPGYSGDGVICFPDACVVAAVPTLPNHIACLYGTATGNTGTCGCDCINGFSGALCNECAAGFGFNGTHCVACENTQANDLTTHDAVCADQQCAAGFGVDTDGFDFTLDPTDTSTSNCELCTGKQASPAGNGICITQTCGDDQQVTTFPQPACQALGVCFDNTLDPTTPNANCIPCDAGFTSDAGVDPTCTDINECISTDNPNFPQLCDFTGTQVGGCNTDDGPNTRNCVCKPGYTGDRCQIDINECDPNPCQNGASCVDGIADYTCICPVNSHESNPVAGWTGKNCTDDVNECDSFITNDCAFGTSTCTNTQGDFTCTCNAEYDDDSTGAPGRICTIKSCILGNTSDSWTIDCNGRGTPFVGTTAGNCFCACTATNSIGGQAWAGTNCETNLDECVMSGNNNCHPNAQCTDTDGDFFCTCDAEYDGDGVTCELKQCVEQHYVQVDDGTECLSSELISAVQALVAASSLPAYSNSPEQSGSWNYIGENCVYYVNDNTNENRVLYSTTPNTANDPARRSYDVCKCETCADKYALLTDDTLTCDSLNQDSWTINCNGNANITGLAGSCGCDCNATNSIGGLAYSGTNCETNVNECLDPTLNDCDPDATCIDTVGDFTCSCNTGYEFAHYVQITDQTLCLSSEVINAAENTIVPAKFGSNEQYGDNAEGDGNWGWVGQHCIYYTNVNQQQQNRLLYSTTPQTSTQFGKTSYPVCICETCTNDKYDIVTESVLEGSCDDLNFKTCTEKPCTTSSVPTTTPGEMYCLHGNATGLTGSCGCICEDGWEGTNCDQDVNECLDPLLNDCLPYHICNNTPGTYSCLCKFGFISTPGDPPLCTCDVGRHYNASEGTCRECEYPTTNDQQNSECVHAQCLQNQYIEPDDGSFTNFLPFDHVSNCAACWPGTFSDDAFSTECDDTNECLAGIAATCGEFNDNGTMVPMGVCNESSQDPTIALTFFRCTPNPGFECPPNNGPCTDTTECDANPCTGGPNTASCDDTYTSADPTGFRCTCNPGYSGALCEIADPCNATLNSNDLGLDGNYYCRYGDIGGTTGTCICTCHSGFTGSHCDVCPAGSGFSNNTCALCVNPFTNDQVTHDAPCVDQSCGLDRGVIIDGLSFDNTLDGTLDNANCEPCPPGMESPDGSGICSAIICLPNEKVVNHVCTPCEMGSLNLDGGDDASGNNTECDGVPCFQDERVDNHICLPCPPGTTNDAGDLRNGPDTVCDPVICLEDEKVVNNECAPCQPGAENEPGDDASGPNTACEAILCDVNEYVSANNCTPCAPLYVNLAGDDATQPDTQCILGCLPNEGVVDNACVPCEDSYVYPGLANPEGPDVDCIYEGTCGNGGLGFVWCDENNTYICANDMCACKPGFVGRECTADAIADDSPSTQKKLDLVNSFAPKEALPDDDTIIIFQQNVAVHLSDIVTGFVNQGGNTINNVFQHTVEINRLTKRQQIAVGDTKTLLAAAPMLGDDDCVANGPLSRHCSSFNYRGIDDIVFLQTPKGFWSVVVKAETLVSKQTSINNTDFEMQCWVGSGWGPKVTRYRDDLVMCNGFVLLMGSQAPICQATVTEPTGHILPGTCGLHGQCAIDGLSYTCVCSPGFTGEFCEEVYVQPAHCHEVDCNNYGGHNVSVGIVPTPMLQSDLVPYCCNYDTRAEFDAVCDAETQAQAYANLGCCSRTFCV